MGHDIIEQPHIVLHHPFSCAPAAPLTYTPPGCPSRSCHTHPCGVRAGRRFCGVSWMHGEQCPDIISLILWSASCGENTPVNYGSVSLRITACFWHPCAVLIRALGSDTGGINNRHLTLPVGTRSLTSALRLSAGRIPQHRPKVVFYC